MPFEKAQLLVTGDYAHDPAVSVVAIFRHLGMRVAPQVSDDCSFSAINDFADVANDVFSIFILK
jgi:hypothetical protein